MHPQRRRVVGALLPAVVLASALVAALASAQPAPPRTDTKPLEVDAGGPGAGGLPATRAPKPNDDLVRQGARLLDQNDLVQRGGSLLPQPQKGAKKRAGKDDGARVAMGLDGGGTEAERVAAAAEAERVAAAAEAAAADGGADGGAAAPEGGTIGEGGGTGASAGADGGSAAAAAERLAREIDAGVEPDVAAPPRGALGQFGGKRTPENQSAMDGVTESPLMKLGIPPKAVPAAAAAVAAGLMLLWTPLLKVITGILKSLLAGRLKTRAKKGQKIDETMRVIEVRGLQIRPAEVGAICVAALLYGIAVCYVLQGRKMQRGFVFRQELLVLAIYQARSAVRFGYERVTNLKTQFRFWPGGGFLCLASAYLGNALGTVGYEIEGTGNPDDAKRIVKMKVWLLAFAFAMAIAFCVANLATPGKFLQSARVMMSGAALAEIMPITPMPGHKIWAWNKTIWAVLFVLVVPGFFVMNFLL
jgi:hypothetical protein